MPLFKGWIIMFIIEFLWIIFTSIYFIVWVINLERVLLVQNLPTWFKCAILLIYKKLYYNNYTPWIIIFESWTSLVINEFLWIIFPCSYFTSGDIHLEIFPYPKPHNLGQIHTITYIQSVILNCLYLDIDALWNLDENGY